jgi:hypothetical protein
MVDATAYTDTQDFRIGKIFGQTFSIFARKGVFFSLVAGVYYMPMEFIDYWGGKQHDPELILITGGLIFAFLLLIAPFASAILTHAAFRTIRNQPISLSDSINYSIQRLLPVIGLSFLMGLGIVGGFILLVVPGLILLTMWSVAIPVCVLEKHRIIDSLNRSATLTKGYRWQVFALVIIAILMSGIITNFVGVGMEVTVGAEAKLVALIICDGIIQSFFVVFTVVIYHELRVVKEGLDTEKVASVFG